MKILLQRISTKDFATLAQRTIASSKNGKYKVRKINLYLRRWRECLLNTMRFIPNRLSAEKVSL